MKIKITLTLLTLGLLTTSVQAQNFPVPYAGPTNLVSHDVVAGRENWRGNAARAYHYGFVDHAGFAVNTREYRARASGVNGWTAAQRATNSRRPVLK